MADSFTKLMAEYDTEDTHVAPQVDPVQTPQAPADPSVTPVAPAQTTTQTPAGPTAPTTDAPTSTASTTTTQGLSEKELREKADGLTLEEAKAQALLSAHKADVSTGRLRAASDELRQARADMAALQKELADIRAAKADLTNSAREVPVTPAAPVQSAYIAKVREDYGDEMADYLAQQEADKQALRAELHAIKGQAGKPNAELDEIRQQVQQVRQLPFQQELKRLVPDFDEIDASPSWGAFLDSRVQPDMPFTYREAGQRAFQSQDAATIKKLADAWKAKEGFVAQKAPAPTVNAYPASVAAQVMPHASTGPAPSTSRHVNGKMYTERQYADEWDRLSQLVRSNTPDADKLATKLENELEAAKREGRIQG